MALCSVKKSPKISRQLCKENEFTRLDSKRIDSSSYIPDRNLHITDAFSNGLRVVKLELVLTQRRWGEPSREPGQAGCCLIVARPGLGCPDQRERAQHAAPQAADQSEASVEEL